MPSSPRRRPGSRRPIQSGLDVLVADRFRQLKGRRVGLLASGASVDSQLVHAVDRFRGAAPEVELVRLFGPQHGFWGEHEDPDTQWRDGRDPATGLEVVSLFGAQRKPPPDRLADLDALVIDLPEVGARCHTYLWTAALCLQACRAASVEVFVLDRPNPIGGRFVEGPGIDEGFESDRGLHSLPLRHGFTLGEALRWIAERIGTRVRVVKMRGWNARPWFDRSGLPWIQPCPLLPTIDALALYPGLALLDATTLSLGRGTTRPFELVGAPWLAPRPLLAELGAADLPGLRFRPCRFIPTHGPHAGRLCAGAQIHPIDKDRLFPVRSALALLAAARAQATESLWLPPSSESDPQTPPPIDLLAGGPELRLAIDAGESARDLSARWEPWEEAWRIERLEYLLYSPRLG